MNSASAIIGTVGSLLIGILLPLICSYYVQTPLDKLYWGLGWYRFPVMNISFFLFIWIPVILVPILFVIIPDMKRHAFICTSAQFIGIVVLIIIALYGGYNGTKEEAMCNDYLIRTQQWEKVIQNARLKMSNRTESTANMNRVFSQSGKMGNLFNYFQQQDLLSNYEHNFTLPLITAEIYYYMGYVNIAGHYYKEAAKAIPYGQLSGQILQRLAEIDMINGKYKGAENNFNIMQKSLFYHKFADSSKSIIYNEQAINSDPIYGQLRKNRPLEDIIFEKNEKRGIIDKRYNHSDNPGQEYLMAYYLLAGNMPQFARCLPLDKDFNYNGLPYSYQQAVRF